MQRGMTRSGRWGLWVAIISMVALIAPLHGEAPPFHRFVLHGNGTLVLKVGGQRQRLAYRDASGQYLPDALRVINRHFRGAWDDPMERIELRLLEALDAVQDHFGERPLVLLSGYRSRGYNTGLRREGKLAAQSSMHIEGGAADFFLEGVRSDQLATYARSLGCCGVGYYHGQELHLDVGPVRFWDESTSGTESLEPQRNAKILVVTDYDRYRAGEPVALRFMRVTELPVVIPAHWDLECQVDGQWRRLRPVSVHLDAGGAESQLGCWRLSSVAATRASYWIAQPRRQCRGDYRFRVQFCDRVATTMPEVIYSNSFHIEEKPVDSLSQLGNTGPARQKILTGN